MSGKSEFDKMDLHALGRYFTTIDDKIRALRFDRVPERMDTEEYLEYRAKRNALFDELVRLRTHIRKVGALLKMF